MFPAAQIELAIEILERCRSRGLRLATAESCTGGLIAACLTDIAGSSDVFERGLVAYANQAKIDLLDVAPECLARFGAVSEETARAMAEGGLARSKVDLCVAVTGIAGPGGGSAGRPVGLVHFATAGRDQPTRHAQSLFSGDRQAVRQATVTRALELLRACL
ncbi:Damage-inducible protein CinA [uncultured Defluviicoccus sp.]|uniref:Damage-inducible protein CinA n=1 Tax=metagenome TaxID=256318 RepID=A0A380TEC1_9ZZZZ|nr:Damage-inducible protein CinA [uncultured Defluviicoccus sp.]